MLELFLIVKKQSKSGLPDEPRFNPHLKIDLILDLRMNSACRSLSQTVERLTGSQGVETARVTFATMRLG